MLLQCLFNDNKLYSTTRVLLPLYWKLSLLPSVLQELKGADASAGREPAGLQCRLQREADEEERAQAEDHSSGRGGHRAGPTEQGAD